MLWFQFLVLKVAAWLPKMYPDIVKTPNFIEEIV